MYTGKFSLSVLNLKHIDLATDEDRKWDIDKWAALFKSGTWEEMRMIAAQDVEMTNASRKLYEKNQDKYARIWAEAHEEFLWRERRSKKRVEDAERHVEDAERQLEAAERHAEAVRKQAETLEKQAEAAEKHLEDARKRAEDAERHAEDVRKQAEILEKQAEAAEKQAEAAEKQAKIAEKRADKAEAENEYMRALLEKNGIPYERM